MQIPPEKILIRQGAAYRAFDMTAHGFKILQDKNPDFPKPLKFGTSRQSPVYYDAAELRGWVERQKSKGVPT